MKTILITGATGGIGQALVKKYLDNNYQVIITSTSQQKIDQLIRQYQPKQFIFTQVLDLCDLDQIKIFCDNVIKLNIKIDVIINNAGNAFGLEPYYESDFNLMMKTIDLNVKSLMALNYYLTPLLLQQNEGHIINMSSTAGQCAYPNGMAYCASKAAVKMVSDGMRLDLMKSDVKVSSIMPGIVETNFSKVRFNGDEDKANKAYQGLDCLQAIDVAEACFYVSEQPKHVVVGDISLLANQQGNGFTFHRE